MYRNILVPVDLAHADKLDKALATAADLARLYNCDLHLGGVTTNEPTTVAHSPSEFDEKLKAFAAKQSVQRGIQVRTHSAVAKDIAIDLDETLQHMAKEVGADLIVMASHVPSFKEYVIASNAGHLASHTDLSIFIVR